MCLSLPKAVCFIRRLYSSPSFNRQPPAKDVYNVLEAGVYRGLARYAWLRMVRNQELEITFCVQGVSSPLLANVYLHYVFDLWVERWRRRNATGDMIVVRYADDIVVGFEHKTDAHRFLEEMRERLQAFALTLHPEKTRLIAFGRQAANRREKRGLGKPETFNFLGFTFICGKSRRGKFLL